MTQTREMPQRQLALSLRSAIDEAENLSLNAPATIRSMARQRIRKLIRENPHGYRSSHVQHNLGAGRVAWLRHNRLL